MPFRKSNTELYLVCNKVELQLKDKSKTLQAVRVRTLKTAVFNKKSMREGVINIKHQTILRLNHLELVSFGCVFNLCYTMMYMENTCIIALLLT